MELEPLSDLLLREFADRGWSSIETIVEFVRHTHYSEEKHLRTQALAPLETSGRVEVRRPSGKRIKIGEYPAGTSLLFRG